MLCSRRWARKRRRSATIPWVAAAVRSPQYSVVSRARRSDIRRRRILRSEARTVAESVRLDDRQALHVKQHVTCGTDIGGQVQSLEREHQSGNRADRHGMAEQRHAGTESNLSEVKRECGADQMKGSVEQIHGRALGRWRCVSRWCRAANA